MNEEVGRVPPCVLAQVMFEDADRLAIAGLAPLGGKGQQGLVRLLQIPGDRINGLGDDLVLLVLGAVSDGLLLGKWAVLEGDDQLAGLLVPVDPRRARDKELLFALNVILFYVAGLAA